MNTGDLARRTKVLVTIGVMLGMLLAALDQTIVSTAMPRIVASLNGFDRYAWVATSYLVTSTVLTPIAGKLGDLFGRKPFLLTGMAGFMFMSWLCGFSQDMNQLIVFRGGQGVFGGILFASVFTVLADIYPPAQRARMQGLFAGTFGLSAIFGPTAGGWITDHVTYLVPAGEGWRWIFYINVPVGLVAIAMTLAFLPYVRSKASWRDIDYWGALTMAAGLTAILIGLSITNTHAWTSPQVLSLVAGGLVLMAVFFVIEHFEPEPIIPLALFRERAYVVSTVVGVAMAFAMFGSLLFVQLEYQGVLGISATSSGALFTPMMAGMITASILTGQVMTRIKRYQYLGTVGAALALIGFYLLSEVTIRSTQTQVAGCLVMIGAGMGVTMPLYLTALQSSVEPKFLGVVSSNMQFWRNVGGTVATAVLGSILVTRLPINIKAHLPASMAGHFTNLGGGGNTSPEGLFSPEGLAKLHQALGPVYGTVLTGLRAGLADTLHELFLIGAVAVAIGVVASVFMPTIALRRTRMPAAVGEGPPVPVEPIPEEAAV